MSIQRTLSIVKPDAVAKNVIGQIVARFEQAGLKVIAARLQQLARRCRALLRRAQRAPFFRTWSTSWSRAPYSCKCWKAKKPSRRTVT